MKTKYTHLDNYVLIPYVSIKACDLKGNEAIAFGIIHGFCKDRETRFTGSLAYLADIMNVSKPTVMKALKGLLERGLLLKESESKNNITFVTYSIDWDEYNLQVDKFLYGYARNLHGGGKETCMGGGKETLPNNTISNNTNDKPNLEPQKDLFGGNPKKKTRLSNSTLTKDLFIKKLEADFFSLGVDLDYYYNQVSDWSDSRDQKKTVTGWLACARNWIRKDNTGGKMKKKNSGEFMEGAKSFLTRD